MATLTEMSDLLKIISDKTRLTILALLKEREMCVCDIVEILQTTQPNVSQHLKKLKTIGLVNETRRSHWIYYSLNVEDKPYVKQVLSELPSMKKDVDDLSPDNCN
ncbi:ArsR family transcriptional regulator [Cohnella kolymensis]|uniref:ArsR family transcriptional regulator n=1 Tax=Cohnella kolymensis TaxID=1590652 RepID=A0ABR4ZZH9_9BACL|nr:metalloregulator ArsR/SmtB family transcription factor [Cohnella kolymensis]KIL34215.1 ArsR family transcriptional regulator [Cohnella kolymensis]